MRSVRISRLRIPYPITVREGKFSDGTTAPKQIAQGASVTASAYGLPSNGWTGYTTNGDTQTDNYRTYSWTGDTTKTVTVTQDQTITFSYTYSITSTRYRYLIRFYDGSTEYTAKRTWTNENGNGGFTFASAPTKTDYDFKGWGTSTTSTTGSAAGSSGTATAPKSYYAIWQLSTIYARDLQYSNTTYTTCTQSQCAIDELANLLK